MVGPGFISPGTMFHAGRGSVMEPCFIDFVRHGPLVPSPMTTRKTVVYAAVAIVIVLGAAVAMAYGGQLANAGPWAKAPRGHAMPAGMTPHGAGDNMTCSGQGDQQTPDHGSGGNRTHSGNASCSGMHGG